MRDPSELPHPKLRTACFWVLFAAWPAFWTLFDLWLARRGRLEIDGFSGSVLAGFAFCGSLLAVVTSLAYLIGKLLFQETQREQSWRLARVEKRITGAESVAVFFDEDGRFSPPDRRPPLAVVPDGSGAATSRWNRRVHPRKGPERPT